MVDLHFPVDPWQKTSSKRVNNAHYLFISSTIKTIKTPDIYIYISSTIKTPRTCI